MTSPHIRRGAALGLALTLTTSVASAQAPDHPTPPTHPVKADPCGYTPAKVFAPWHDNKGYVLSENGGFEQGDAGWTLAGGAAVVEGNETFAVGGAGDHQALALP